MLSKLVVVLLCSLALPVTAWAAPAADTAGEEDNPPGCLHALFCYKTVPDLHPALDEKKTLLMVLGLVPLGNIWAPLVLLPKEAQTPLRGDTLKAGIIWAAVPLAVVAAAWAFWWLVPVVGWYSGWIFVIAALVVYVPLTGWIGANTVMAARNAAMKAAGIGSSDGVNKEQK